MLVMLVMLDMLDIALVFAVLMYSHASTTSKTNHQVDYVPPSLLMTLPSPLPTCCPLA